MNSAPDLSREAFEAAVTLARAALFEGVPVADLAAKHGVQPWKVAALVVQPLTEVMIGIADAANSPAEIMAAVAALQSYDDEVEAVTLARARP